MPYRAQNSEQVRQLSVQLDVRATALEETVSQVTTAIRAVHWTGPDADRWKTEWFGEHLPNATKTIAAMREASQVAARDAADSGQANAAR